MPKRCFLENPYFCHFRAVSFRACLCSAGLKMHCPSTLGGTCTLVNFELRGLQRRPESDPLKNAILALVSMDLQNHSEFEILLFGL